MGRYILGLDVTSFHQIYKKINELVLQDALTRWLLAHTFNLLLIRVSQVRSLPGSPLFSIGYWVPSGAASDVSNQIAITRSDFAPFTVPKSDLIHRNLAFTIALGRGRATTPRHCPRAHIAASTSSRFQTGPGDGGNETRSGHCPVCCPLMLIGRRRPEKSSNPIFKSNQRLGRSFSRSRKNLL